VLVPGLFLAASGLARADVCVAQGRKDEHAELRAPSPSMVQRDVLESAISVDEEQQETLEVAAPGAQLTTVETPEVAAARLSKVDASRAAPPNAPQSKVEATPAPRLVAQPQLELLSKSHAGSLSKADNSNRDVGSLMEAINRRYSARAAVGTQMLRSMKHGVAAELNEFLRRLGVLELEAITTRASWEMVILVPLVVVGIIVLLMALRAWWKDTVANKEQDGSCDPKSQPARGSFREASFTPRPKQAAQASQLPSLMGLLASPGKPRELTPAELSRERTRGKTSRATPQKSATPLVQQTDRQSEKRSATPTPGPGWHLCSELVVPENNECRLLIPEIIEDSSNMSSVLSINDVNGIAVLFAAYCIGERPPAGQYDLPGNGKRLILRSALEDIILASCKDAEPETAGGPCQLAILNRSEEPFGILRATGPGPKSGYMVALSSGKKLSVRRDIQALSSWITDEDGWLLGCCEDTGEHSRTIRISPQADVGLMTLTMLGIDILDISMAAHGSCYLASSHGNASQQAFA